MLALKEWLPGLGKKKVAFNETFSSNKILNKTPKDGREKEEFQHYRMFRFFTSSYQNKTFWLYSNCY